MKKHQKLSISAFTLALLATTAVIIYAMRINNTLAKPAVATYFKYTPDEIAQIKKTPSVKSNSAVNLPVLDSVMFKEVKINNTEPTLASRYYAYVLVAQKDAYALAANHNKDFDSMSKTSDQVTCVFYPERCPPPVTRESAEDTIAKIITQKVWERYNLDTFHTAEAVKMMEPIPEIWHINDVITPEAGAWKTWLITEPGDFLAPSPPNKNSSEEKIQIAAVKNALKNNTAEQKEKVTYWAAGSNTATPAGLWIEFANEYMATHQTPLEKQIEVRSQLAMTLADTFISCWHTKYVYLYERPFMRSPDIKPLIQTPNFPSYVSGHSAVSAAAATILSHYFPENSERWKNMAREAANSRLWAGIHYPIDNQEGLKMGEKIANTVIGLKNTQPVE